MAHGPGRRAELQMAVRTYASTHRSPDAVQNIGASMPMPTTLSPPTVLHTASMASRASSATPTARMRKGRPRASSRTHQPNALAPRGSSPMSTIAVRAYSRRGSLRLLPPAGLREVEDQGAVVGESARLARRQDVARPNRPCGLRVNVQVVDLVRRRRGSRRFRATRSATSTPSSAASRKRTGREGVRLPSPDACPP